MDVNGWELYYFKLFSVQLTDLENAVQKLKAENPDTYKQHPKTKLLASVYNAIINRVPADPNHKQFFLGNTLGSKYRSWKRVKQGLPNRYRLFFKLTAAPKKIIYVWFNDETTLRKEGAKTDVYVVFCKMLNNGQVPDSIDDLLKHSTNHR
jgi:toxin YhaV